jgi:hypothetical protein
MDKEQTNKMPNVQIQSSNECQSSKSRIFGIWALAFDMIFRFPGLLKLLELEEGQR